MFIVLAGSEEVQLIVKSDWSQDSLTLSNHIIIGMNKNLQKGVREGDRHKPTLNIAIN